METPNPPQVCRSVATLFEWMQGPIRFALLTWGLEVDVFTRCAEPRKCQALARELNLDAGQLGYLLNAMTSIGLLTRSGGKYVTAPAFQPFLDRNSQTSLVPTLQSLASLRHDGLERLHDYAVRAPERPDAPSLFGAVYWERATASLKAFHRACAVDTMLDTLESTPGWREATTLLDLGAGSEILARRIVERAPEKRVVVFDLEPVARILSGCCAGESRIEVVAGDYNDFLPDGPFDIVWASMSLYFIRGGLDRFFERLIATVRPGGCFVSFHEGLSQERTQPEWHVIGRLVPTLKGKDVSFDHGEIRSAAVRAGFDCAISRPVATEFGPFDLNVLRRPAQ
ncbi:MAG: methyltransferase domain-containing protein [Pseudomonadota bacterium]